MALGSFTHGALAELSADDFGRMLELDETLFVEHKGDIGDDKDTIYGLVSTVAAFANTYGGWLLIGVTNRKPNGNAGRWSDAEDDAPTLVDAIRARLRGEIDPLPAFEAKLIQHADGPVAVVRVYESSDTPHVVLRSGAVFVREPAEHGMLPIPSARAAGHAPSAPTKPPGSAVANRSSNSQSGDARQTPVSRSCLTRPHHRHS